jgi:hypothetical protein
MCCTSLELVPLTKELIEEAPFSRAAHKCAAFCRLVT